MLLLLLLVLGPESGVLLNLVEEEVEAEFRSSRLGAVGAVEWGVLSTVDAIVGMVIVFEVAVFSRSSSRCWIHKTSFTLSSEPFFLPLTRLLTTISHPSVFNW